MHTMHMLVPSLHRQSIDCLICSDRARLGNVVSKGHGGHPPGDAIGEGCAGLQPGCDTGTTASHVTPPPCALSMAWCRHVDTTPMSCL